MKMKFNSDLAYELVSVFKVINFMIIYRFFTFLTLLLYTLTGEGQSYFNQLVDCEDGPPTITNLIVTDSFYIIPMINYYKDSIPVSSFMLIDKEDLSDVKIKRIPYHAFVRNTPGRIKGHYYAFCNEDRERSVTSLIKIDSTYAYEVLQKYLSNSPGKGGGTTMTISGDYIYGARLNTYKMGTVTRVDNTVLKLDTTGKQIWQKTYDTSHVSSFIWNIKTLRDSALLLIKNNLDSLQQPHYAELVKISPEDGHVIWKMRSQEDLDFSIRKVNAVQLSDGRILMDYIGNQNSGNPNYERTAHYWEWRNSENGHLLKDSLLYIPRYEIMIAINFIKGKGDYFFVLGRWNTKSNKYYGVLEKHTNDGRLIWEHWYRLEGDTTSAYWLTDMVEEDNGDIIMTGELRSYPKHVWLLRVNSFGCLGEGIDCNKILIHTELVPRNVPLSSIRLFPNPSAGLYHIDWDKEWRHKIERIDLLGSNGSIFMQDIAHDESNLDIRHIPSGLYFVQFRLKTGKVIYTKVVKE